ncbi:DUF2520 domain-containing protein, partial [Mycolicibacterium smegmatis]
MCQGVPARLPPATDTVGVVTKSAVPRVGLDVQIDYSLGDRPVPGHGT